MSEEETIAAVVAYLRRCAENADHPDLVQAAKQTEGYLGIGSHRAREAFLRDIAHTTRGFFRHAADHIERGDWREP